DVRSSPAPKRRARSAVSSVRRVSPHFAAARRRSSTRLRERQGARGLSPRITSSRGARCRRGDKLPFVTASLDSLRNIAAQLRIDSVRSTSEAGSGHPTSCMSAADIVAALFFSEMRFDPQDPQNPDNDRFILSKGHAAPVLYAAWAEAGLFPREELLKLRRIDSDLEGHPTPRLSFVDVATGSLGQGICAAVGIALNARRIGSDYRTYCVLGDGESAEGSVWEAAEAAAHDKIDSLCGITDVNALGQSGPTQWQHDMEAYRSRWSAPRAPQKGTVGALSYTLGDSVATREAYGAAIAKLGTDPRIVALDGDVKNSTFSEKFEEVHRDRFFQSFIAEQVMIGSAMG